MRRNRGIRLLGLAWLVVCPLHAAADGKGFPAQAIAEIPKIPSQRAIIVWKDGVETLVVESALDTPSSEVGWVLPLPAAPTKLDVAHAGILTSMSSCQSPSIVADLAIFRKIAFAVGILVVPGALVTLLVRDARKRRRMRRVAYAGVVIGVLVWAALLAPALSSKSAGLGASASTGVDIVASKRVGNYEATVLRAATADALDAWLTGGGLRGLDAADRRAVDDYIKRKWCFVVARLRKDVEKATPHPIQATFAAAAPVYPMKLTGLSGSAKTRVELFVIADRQARAEHFECIVADRYRREGGRLNLAAYYVSGRGDLIIGSPDACELMWRGCVVTALTADLTPRQMDRDVELSLVPLVRQRQVRYTVGARRDVMTTIVVGGFLAVLAGVAAACKGRRGPSARAAAGLAALVLVVLAAAAVPVWAMPTIPTRVTSHHHPGSMCYQLVKAIMMLDYEGHLDGPPRDESLPTVLDLLVEKGLFDEDDRLNPFTGEPMRAERSPGNCAIRVIKNRPFICWYDVHGREFRERLILEED